MRRQGRGGVKALTSEPLEMEMAILEGLILVLVVLESNDLAFYVLFVCLCVHGLSFA